MSENILMKELVQMHTENIALMGRMSEYFSIHGEEAILLCLHMETEPVFAGDLKKKTELTSGRIATILKSLEAKNYITRRQDEIDKRKVLVELTEDGRKFTENELKRIIEAHRNLLEYLGEADSAEFIRIMKNVLCYVSEHDFEFM